MRGTWEGTGRPVVLLHGQPGSGDDWALVRQGLQGVRVLAPDRPGYDGLPAEDLAGNARQLSLLLRDTGVGRAIFVGHSWGGGVALQMALDYPEQVAGLCLVGSIGSLMSVTSRDRLLARPGLAQVTAVAMCATAVLAPRLFARAAGSVLSAEGLQDMRWRGRRWLRYRIVWTIAAEQRFLVLGAEQLAGRLGDVSASALIVTGAHDLTVSPAAAADLARALPRGVLLTLPGGHLLPQETPEVLAAAIQGTVADAAW